MTGSTSSTIHVGLAFDLRKSSTTFRRLIAFCLRWPLEERDSSRRRYISEVSSMRESRSRTASAPMPARKARPNRSWKSRYWVSVRICLACRASRSVRVASISCCSASSWPWIPSRSVLVAASIEASSAFLSVSSRSLARFCAALVLASSFSTFSWTFASTPFDISRDIRSPLSMTASSSPSRPTVIVRRDLVPMPALMCSVAFLPCVVSASTDSCSSSSSRATSASTSAFSFLVLASCSWRSSRALASMSARRRTARSSLSMLRTASMSWRTSSWTSVTM